MFHKCRRQTRTSRHPRHRSWRIHNRSIAAQRPAATSSSPNPVNGCRSEKGDGAVEQIACDTRFKLMRSPLWQSERRASVPITAQGLRAGSAWRIARYLSRKSTPWRSSPARPSACRPLCSLRESGDFDHWAADSVGHYRTSVFLESDALSEHSCRAQDDRLWNDQSQRFGRLHVDDELELGGLLEREIIQVRPLENPVHL